MAQFHPWIYPSVFFSLKPVTIVGMYPRADLGCRLHGGGCCKSKFKPPVEECDKNMEEWVIQVRFVKNESIFVGGGVGNL